MKLQNYDAAIEDFNRVIDLDPENIEAYTHRGEALFEKGYQEFHRIAINDWKKAIELGAPDIEILQKRIETISKTI